MTLAAEPVCHGEERADATGEAVDLPVNLHEFLPSAKEALGSDQNSKITNTSGGNELCGAQP